MIDCSLDYRASILSRVRDFSLHNRFQTFSVTNTVSYPMGIGTKVPKPEANYSFHPVKMLRIRGALPTLHDTG
jgi:hypothetical protein